MTIVKMDTTASIANWYKYSTLHKHHPSLLFGDDLGCPMIFSLTDRAHSRNQFNDPAVFDEPTYRCDAATLLMGTCTVATVDSVWMDSSCVCRLYD